MTTLRVVLLLGLVLHKAVWEFMKMRDGAPHTVLKQKKPSLIKRATKAVKIAALVFLIVQTLYPKYILPIVDNPEAIQFIGLTIYLTGLAIAISARIRLGTNWSNIEDHQVMPDQQLVQTGFFRYIRHPIYLGDMLLILGLELALNSWLFLGALAMIPYVAKQAREEEKELEKAFPDYETYRQRTKMFIPFLF